MFYVYILTNSKKFYIGLTKDLKRRINEHLNGKVYSTKRFGADNLKLIYYEAFIIQTDAQRREKYLKTTKGRKGLKLILRHTLANCRII